MYNNNGRTRYREKERIYLLGRILHGSRAARGKAHYPWEREGEDTKYNYVVHAELNAILNARGKNLKGARLYVDLFPCNECAKAIIQSGIAEVVYLYNKYADSEATRASARMLQSAGVKLRQFKTDTETIVLDFKANA